MISKFFQQSKSLQLSPLSLFSTKLPSWATLDPYGMSGKNRFKLQNYVQGQWKDSPDTNFVIDPMNGEDILTVPEIKNPKELDEYIQSALQCPKSGLHNPLKNVERYNIYGDVMSRLGEEMRKPEVANFFTKLIQRFMPKSDAQARGEFNVTRKFIENFGGDNPRFLCQGFHVSGDHAGQQSQGYRWPFGRVAVVSPFNFPLEIPTLQIMGALITGNKVTFKGPAKVNAVMEQFFRMALMCGLPPKDVDMIFCRPKPFEYIMKAADFRLTQFTGSAEVAEGLAQFTHGKVKLEDAGFDWKILGPDVQDVDYVAWQCDQDAYAASGQKCSAQSILYCHDNWIKAGILEKIKNIASQRNLNDLTVGPILSLTNKDIQDHVDKALQIPGAKLLFGGKELKGHKIPKCYGSYEPTAIFVPIEAFKNKETFKLVTKEIFGPFQIVTSYNDSQVDFVLETLEQMDQHLTAGVVSNDVKFLNKVLANTVNGVTYSGIRARTTGAPQNHWFGPCGDPRGAGIGTPEAILHVWTSHREIINDFIVPQGWKAPKAT